MNLPATNTNGELALADSHEVREKAAYLVAQGKHSNKEIIAEIGISEPTLIRWKRENGFRASVAKYVEEFRAAVLERGIAQWQNRVEAQNERHEALNRIRRERAAGPGFIYKEVIRKKKDGTKYVGFRKAPIPGWETGLVVKHYKIDGEGRMNVSCTIDYQLLKEQRELEKQAAQELGQWVDVRQINVNDDNGALHTLERRLAELASRGGKASLSVSVESGGAAGAALQMGVLGAPGAAPPAREVEYVADRGGPGVREDPGGRGMGPGED